MFLLFSYRSNHNKLVTIEVRNRVKELLLDVDEEVLLVSLRVKPGKGTDKNTLLYLRLRPKFTLNKYRPKSLLYIVRAGLIVFCGMYKNTCTFQYGR